ncbi:MAG: ATP-binding protein, partial [Actinomycetales bacterium]|nr:ATP-binding protein [Actinomycetales bacterium]
MSTQASKDHMTTTDRAGARPSSSNLRVLLLSSSALLLVFAVGASLQFEFVIREFFELGFPRRLPQRLTANFTSVGVNAVLLWAFRVHIVERGKWGIAGALAAGGAAGLARVVIQLVFDLHPDGSTMIWTTELVLAWLAAGTSNVVALTHMWTRRRAQEQARVAATNELHVHYALQALAHEEIRVRREVAEGLHGSLQQRLVLIARRIEEVLGHLEQREVSDADVAQLRSAVAEMEVAREGDVREMSRLLYPDAIEIGMVPAVRSLLGRLPTMIGTRLVVSDAVRRLDDPAAPALSQTERLLAVRVVEESVTNALRHGGATRLDVVIREEAGRLQIV